ncbi:hypothetical protein [Stygiolobus caldivivus]|uniref:Uncharacterized protein n=1 Tax=Stygiolobus caldivivus TaxID=2824673 RepID=A0A8D5ZJ71_9CREN|nr:hypothetical protein [Stygiolobus caldivivus]BCU71264.1 hypothetical protein KN1_25610 [Stygiolobus caldivivus]
MLKIFKVNIIGLIIISVFLFSAFSYSVFLNHLVLASDTNSSNGTAVDYLHLYVINGENMRCEEIENVSIKFILNASNYTILYNLSKGNYDFRIYKANVTLVINNSESVKAISFVVLYIEKHKDYNITIGISIFNTSRGTFTVIMAYLKPDKNNLNTGDLFFMNTSRMSISDQIIQFSAYVYKIGKLYEKSQNNSIKLLGQRYIEIAKAMKHLANIVKHLWIGNIKSEYIISSVADDTISCAISIITTAGTVAALFVAAVEAAPVSFVLASYLLPFEFANLGYACYGG